MCVCVCVCVYAVLVLLTCSQSGIIAYNKAKHKTINLFTPILARV